MSTSTKNLAAAAVYVLLGTFLFYGSGNAPPLLSEHPWLVIIGVHVLLGFVIASWWALALPLTLFLLALPVSDWNCDSGFECIGEPLALWVLGGALVFAVPCVGLGVAIGKRYAAGDQNSSRLPSGS